MASKHMPDAGPAPVQPAAPAETAPGLAIRLFGPMEVRLGSRPLPRLRSRKGLWLVALLALRAGRDVERRWLAETLWPGDDASEARHSLRQSLHDLRLALGPEAHRLTSEAASTVRLDLSGAFVDALAFDAALARGNLDSLATAVQLYRGPLLEDCAEDWVQPERRPREQAYVAALEQLAAAATARGEHTTAATTLQLAVEVDPCREELPRALMEALAAAGNPAGALLAYRQFRAVLWREISAEPADETTALFRRLRDQSRAHAHPLPPSLAPSLPPSPRPPPAPPQCHLPLPLTELIGREEEVQEVRARLARSRLVTLTGTGGVGKTRLALQVAEEVTHEYADGARFVPLASLADPGRVPDAVRAALGVPPGNANEEPIETLRQYLSSRRLLLVLDNCEHLLDACAALVEALLSRCPELRLLATSRQALGVGGEAVWRVPSLSLPEAPGVRREASEEASGVRREASEQRRGPGSEGDNLRRTDASRLTPDAWLLQFAAIRLFVERARAADPSFEMTPRSAAAIVEVCRRLDGIPLAIELAAARVRAIPVEQIAARLHDRFRLLTGGSRGALPRQQTLRASLDWSYDLLNEPERVLMRRLSVFAGGWTLEAAEAVCAEPEGRRQKAESSPDGPEPDSSTELTPSLPSAFCLLPSDVLDLLTSLVEKSLVLFEPQEPEGRYRLLETVREYFDARRLEAGEEETLRERHLAYFLALAEEADKHLTGSEQSGWLDRLETEHDNLRAALDWALAEGGGQKAEGETQTAVGTPEEPQLSSAFCLLPSAAEAGLRLAAALQNFWLLRRYLTEGRQRLAQALAGGVGTTADRAKALSAAGNLASRQGDYPAAHSLLEESLALHRELEDRSGIATSLRNLGLVAFYEGDYEAARSLTEEGLAIFRELGERSGIAGSLGRLGIIASSQEDFAAAHALYEESLAIFREIGDRTGIAVSLQNLGIVAHRRGQYVLARSFYEESLAIKREMGYGLGIALSLHALGRVAQDLGEYGTARLLQEEGLRMRRDLGDRQGISVSLQSLAGLECEGEGQPDASEGAGIREGARGAATADSASAARRAARLLGAAEALREALGTPLHPFQQEGHRRRVSRARALLDEPAFAAAWAEGRAMTLDHAVAYALGELDAG